MRVAIETGTHSPWVSRLLEECGHEVLVAKARKVCLIYGEEHNNDKAFVLTRSPPQTSMIRRSWRSWWTP